MPAFLPPELEVSRDIGLVIADALTAFRRDFISSQPVLGSLHVSVNAALTAEGWESSFHHVITREPQGSQPRAVDVFRVKRVPWIRPLIENCSDPCITH